MKNGNVAVCPLTMDRLFNSLKSISIDIGMSPEDMRDILDIIAAANGITNNAHCRLMITRGRKARPFQHPRLSRFGPTVLAIIEHSKPVESLQSRGIRLATVPQVRRGLPVSQDAKYNSYSKLNCIIASFQAEQAGADEALMLDPHRFVNTACLQFLHRAPGEAWTSTGAYCVNGVTRQKVIDLCRTNDIPVLQKDFKLYEAYGADEAFLTGTFGDQTPVTEIDGKLVGTGERPKTQRIRELYKALIKRNTGR